MRSLAASCAVLLGTVTLAPIGSTPGQDKDSPFPVQIKVGATLDVCTTGRVVCPAMYPRCDDPKVAVPVVCPKNLEVDGITRLSEGRPPGDTPVGASKLGYPAPPP